MFHIELFDTDIGRFKEKFFWCTIFKVFTELVAGSILHFGFFDCEACGIYAPWPGMELACPAPESKVLTTYWKSFIGKKNLKINSALFLECGMATYSSNLAWKIPRMEEHDRVQSMGWQRVGHDWVTSLSLSRVWRYKMEAKLSLFHLCGQQLLSLILYLSYTLVWNNHKNFHVK